MLLIRPASDPRAGAFLAGFLGCRAGGSV